MLVLSRCSTAAWGVDALDASLSLVGGDEREAVCTAAGRSVAVSVDGTELRVEVSGTRCCLLAGEGDRCVTIGFPRILAWCRSLSTR